MAQAIARDMFIDGASHGHPPASLTRVESAGVAAGSGSHMTREAQDALNAMGVDPGRHRSQPLTQDLIAKATVIYTMTTAHARRVAEMDPAAKAKTHTLDPSGKDIDDPMGGPLAEYRACAERLRTLIRARLEEPHPAPAAPAPRPARSA